MKEKQFNLIRIFAFYIRLVAIAAPTSPSRVNTRLGNTGAGFKPQVPCEDSLPGVNRSTWDFSARVHRLQVMPN